MNIVKELDEWIAGDREEEKSFKISDTFLSFFFENGKISISAGNGSHVYCMEYIACANDECSTYCGTFPAIDIIKDLLMGIKDSGKEHEKAYNDIYSAISLYCDLEEF